MRMLVQTDGEGLELGEAHRAPFLTLVTDSDSNQLYSTSISVIGAF